MTPDAVDDKAQQYQYNESRPHRWEDRPPTPAKRETAISGIRYGIVRNRRREKVASEKPGCATVLYCHIVSNVVGDDSSRVPFGGVRREGP